MSSRTAPVLVLGDVDLVRTLGIAGIGSVVVALPDDLVRWSRHVVSVLPALDHWREAPALVEVLVVWARSQPDRPVLLPQSDGDLLLVSRWRERLTGSFRFQVPDFYLLEDLVDKARFQRLAEASGLPVPRAVALAPGADLSSTSRLRYPVVVKPLLRRDLVGMAGHCGKAIAVQDSAALAALWSEVSKAGVNVLVQELVPGPETRIESWHAYVDESGEVAGEFTGEKIRTWPLEFGHSTALRVTDVRDVRTLGSEVVRRLGVRGLVKVDFKRDPAGGLLLLEVNPRATLWLHLGAVAGLNLVALQHADLTGSPRPAMVPARPGTSWCAPREDWWSARASGLPPLTWLGQTLRRQARSGADRGDPAPFLRGQLAPALARRLRRLLPAGGGVL